jgi:hypothetical protein
MIFTTRRILRYLKQNGIDVQKLRSDPDLAEKVALSIYKAIPIPIRWVVRKKRIRRAVLAVRDRVSRGGEGSTDASVRARS